MLFIFNSDENSIEIRLEAVRVLVSLLEYSRFEISPESLEFFKKHVFDSYNDKCFSIKHSISKIMNSLLKPKDMQTEWKNMFKHLIENIINEDLPDDLHEVSLEIVQNFLEDSDSYDKDKVIEVIKIFLK